MFLILSTLYKLLARKFYLWVIHPTYLLKEFRSNFALSDLDNVLTWKSHSGRIRQVISV